MLMLGMVWYGMGSMVWCMVWYGVYRMQSGLDRLQP